MKVLYATSAHYPSTLANRVQTASMARAFRERLGDDFVFGVARAQNGSLAEPHVVFGTGRSVLLAWRYIRYAKKHGMTHLYCREERLLFFMLLYARLIAYRPTFVYELHHLRYARRWWHRFVLSHVPTLVSITDAMAQEARRAGYRHATLVAPDAVDPSLFDIALSQEAAREVLDLPKDKKIALYVGAIDEAWKGVGTFYGAAEAFGDEELFVIVGGKPDQVARFQEEHPPRKNVLMTGYKDYATEAARYLKAADVLVVPNSAKAEISRVSTSPLKVFMYMAAGRPIVASDLPSLREILNERNAVLVSPDDSEALAAGIRSLFENPQKGAALAAQAHQEVQAHTWDNRAATILDFLTRHA